MKALELRDGFGLDHLALAERPEVAPGPGQVRLHMRAASLNYRDLMMVRGEYNPKQALPLVPGSDGVGEVVEVGAGVSRFVRGARVMPIFAQGWLAGDLSREHGRTTLGGPLDGTLTESMTLDAEAVVAVPEHLGDEEAATLPCAALTAWNAIVTLGRLRAGQTVLVQGTGGVATFALQFARLAGARVIATSSKPEKGERARGLGAWQVLDSKAPDWGRQAAKLAGEGVDLVVEVGGAGTLEQSLAAVRPGGSVMLIGVLSGASAPLSITPILMRQVRVQGVFVGSRETFEAMNRAVALHRLRPVIDRTFDLAQAREAFEYLAAARHVGKVCLRIA